MRRLRPASILYVSCTCVCLAFGAAATSIAAQPSSGTTGKYPTMLDMTFPEFEAAVKRTDIVGVAEMPLRTVIGVGLIQCLSMIPGVSRSGATILGGLSLGVERRTAAEFSFFLAIPTMLGATTLEIARHHDALIAGAGDVGFATVAVGFVVSFVVAIVVVKGFVHYISRHGFAPFAWYRIVAGLVALAWLGMR